jgi:hypothetical protein
LFRHSYAGRLPHYSPTGMPNLFISLKTIFKLD